MKKGNIMRDVISSSQFTENVIKEYKKGLGDMVLVAITPRTTIELPAHLTQAEIDAAQSETLGDCVKILIFAS